MNSALLHYYKRHRHHQWSVYVNGGGTITRYPGPRGYGTGKVELSYASAPYGEHALSAIAAARARIHFMIRLENE